jgi:hypothetical protein
MNAYASYSYYENEKKYKSIRAYIAVWILVTVFFAYLATAMVIDTSYHEEYVIDTCKQEESNGYCYVDTKDIGRRFYYGWYCYGQREFKCFILKRDIEIGGTIHTSTPTIANSKAISLATKYIFAYLFISTIVSLKVYEIWITIRKAEITRSNSRSISEEN